MQNRAVDLYVLCVVTENGPLLTRVREFLENADEAELAAELLKFEQDVGTRFMDHMMNPGSAEEPPSQDLKGMENFLSTVDPENLHDTPELMDGHEMVTYARFKILDRVEAVLAERGAPLISDYAVLMATYRKTLADVFRQRAAAPDSFPAPEPKS